MKRGARRVVRLALFVAGLSLLAWLVGSVGIDRVEAAIAESGPWLPAIGLCELAIIATDVLATRRLLGAGASRVTWSTWVRSTALAYATAVVVPAGRAAGEAARTSALAGDVGWPNAAAATSGVQAAALFGNAAISLVGAVAAITVSRSLGLLLTLNAVICGGLGTLVLTLSRWKRLTRFLRARMSLPETAAAPAARTSVARASLFCLLGRAIQVLQYGVALHAVGGIATIRSALVAQGIHIVGATVGDAVPNQIGATEGAYQLFAKALGLEAAPARALSIALVVRIVQFGLAGTGFLVATLTGRQRAAETR